MRHYPPHLLQPRLANQLLTKTSSSCREEREAADLEASARKADISTKEESLATQATALQASQEDLGRKQEDANKRDQDLDQREKLLGDEKREMLRKEADLREQEKVSYLGGELFQA